MKVSELIEILEDLTGYDPDVEIGLETYEGIELYTDVKDIFLYDGKITVYGGQL